MVKIVVFDSGLGSLSIIKRMQKEFKSEIIYFADRENFPYGRKSQHALKRIILKSIDRLEETFDPDLVVIASNTPSLLLQDIFKKNKKIILVLPPIKKAEMIASNKICILATKVVVESNMFKQFLRDNCKNTSKFFTINASPLVDLVESGHIFNNKNYCKEIIIKELSNKFIKNNVDVVTLSSTHLPFLLPVLNELYPNIAFLDPAKDIACKILKNLKRYSLTNKNKLKILTSSDPISFHNQLKKIGINHKVEKFSIND